MRRIWLRLTTIPASLAAWARAFGVHWAEPSSSRATRVPSACVSRCPGGACLARARMRLRSCSVILGLRPDPGRIPRPATPSRVNRFRWMRTVWGWQPSSAAICALRFASPAQQHHLGVNFPISRRVMAPGQFAYLSFFLRILRRSRFHLLGHLCVPPWVFFSSLILSPMRNAALGESSV